MTVRDIEYIEFYAADKQRVTDYFMSSLGFTLVAESADNGRNSILLRHGELQLVVTAGRGTEEFPEAHGDGVADVALTCADVAAVREAVVAAGGVAAVSATGDPVVPGFGGCRHTLLPAKDSVGGRGPAGRRWTATQPAPSRAGKRNLSLDHVAICVKGSSLQDYAGFYESGLGLGRPLVCPDAEKGPGQLDARDRVR